MDSLREFPGISSSSHPTSLSGSAPPSLLPKPALERWFPGTQEPVPGTHPCPGVPREEPGAQGDAQSPPGRLRGVTSSAHPTPSRAGTNPIPYPEHLPAPGCSQAAWQARSRDGAAFPAWHPAAAGFSPFQQLLRAQFATPRAPKSLRAARTNQDSCQYPRFSPFGIPADAGWGNSWIYSPAFPNY